ncbi:hypothetical protein XccvBFoX7_gp22 [Xanthomonas phage FoX7]|uniref:Uncharacterized protein n=2 Tax=Carpasinavirus XcP1 TaxID=2182344 RepID=A0A858NP82_9CAUD|nr:hypothetical protein XccvBFoX6_gp22 [Xanthomonas phage FoX6]QJB22179.1 hypothetical protein XccvBFoX7_gp22 [Xanthomonas phage FoX7]
MDTKKTYTQFAHGIMVQSDNAGNRTTVAEIEKNRNVPDWMEGDGPLLSDGIPSSQIDTVVNPDEEQVQRNSVLTAGPDGLPVVNGDAFVTTDAARRDATADVVNGNGPATPALTKEQEEELLKKDAEKLKAEDAKKASETSKKQK